MIDPKKCKKLLVDFIVRHRWSYVFGIFVLIVTSLITMTIPQILGVVTDALVAHQPWMDVMGMIGLLVVVSVAIFWLKYLWRYLLIGNCRTLEVYLRSHLFGHLQTLPVSFYSERKTGDLVAYAINDIQAIRMTFGGGFIQALDGLMIATISVVFMSSLVNPLLAFATLAPLVFAILLLVSLAKPIRERFSQVQASFASISDRVQETMAGIRVIKAFVQEKAEIGKFADLGRERVKAQMRLVRVSALLGPGIQICFGASFLIFIVFGSRLVADGTISLGDFVAFNLFIVAIMGPVAMISRIIEIWQKGIASYRRLNVLFAIEPAPGAGQGPALNHELKGKIEVRNLTFRYAEGLKPALQDINLTLEAGQTLGILGATGSGKTTLASLLLRLHPVDDDSLFIDDQDINDLRVDVLRENIGYVPQDHFLFSTTIRNNIEFFRPGPTEDEIEEAARQSGVYDSIIAFPDGFETLVGERGVTLSGGQKQRISIARALVKDPAILILDDSLSAVDSQTEAHILGNIREVLAGRTGLIISHRVSTVRHADQIIVLDEGHIVERGTHELLMAENGRYRKLHDSQEVTP